MNRIFYFLICITVLNISCRRDGGDNTQQVYNQFHGKYRPVTAITDAAIDINGDGAATTDLLAEMDYQMSCYTEIRIIDKNNFMWSQMWPEQFLSPGNSPPVINYACQGTARFFTISEDKTALVLKPDTITIPDPNLWVRPSSITIEGKDLLKVVFTKQFYTAGGWQTVTATVVYERFTMVT